MRNTQNKNIIYKPTAKVKLAFTAATTGIITAAAHGLQEGDLIHLTTSGADLPDGLSIATDYYLIDVAAGTFKLSTIRGGSAVAIGDAGTGTHTYHLKGRSIYIGDWRHNVLHLTFSGTPTMTVKVQGSLEDDSPDFNAAQSTTNLWDYIQVIDLESGLPIDGDTGIACAGSADNRELEININGLDWITVAITAWTAGYLGIILKSYN